MEINGKILKYIAGIENHCNESGIDVWNTKGMKKSQLKATLPPDVHEFVDKVSSIVKAGPTTVLQERDEIHIHYSISMGNFRRDALKKLISMGLDNLASSMDGGDIVAFVFKVK